MAEPSKPGRKAGVTLAEIEERRAAVFEMMLQGMRPYDIHALIKANAALKKLPEDDAARKRYRADLDWGVGRDQIEEYYAQAKARLLTVTVDDAKSVYRRSQLRMEDLYRRAVSKGDLVTARHIEKDIRRLHDINAFDHGTGIAPKGGEGEQRSGIQLPDGTIVDL